MSPSQRLSANERIIVACIVVGGFTLVVLGSAGQEYLYGTMRSGSEKSFWLAVRWPSFFWYGWALLTPLVFAVAKRYRLDGTRTAWKLAMLTLSAIAIVLLHIAFQATVMSLPVYQGLHPDFADAVSFHFYSSISTNLITFGLIVGAWYAGTYYHTLRTREVQQVNLESELARAELQALKMQIQPHFLFNALNGISELMYRDVPAAERMLANLGGLLRTSIDRARDQLVTLEEEMAFVQHYLEIERIRFPDRLQVCVDVDEAVREAFVPSLILQPFAENAVNHGVAALSRPVNVRIRATETDGQLRLEVTDDGPGSPWLPTSEPIDGARGSPTPEVGIGISNVRRRLEHLFGDDHSLRFSNTGEGFTVIVEIPLLLDPVGPA